MQLLRFVISEWDWDVIRDQFGNVIAAGAQGIVAGYSPQIAEATCILRGMVFAFNSGLFSIVFKFDALDVVNMINSGFNVSSASGLVVDDIKECLRHVVGGSISFVSKNADVVSHNLAKYALSIAENRF
ncbi:hypothetical protein Dsin_001769 [Dipteronia sinensis]|uniref:RNase H type-1 domain-containing protein n=1 Tax=Dipteronia sinensis TaxID=43782 RepID=A0AAE0B4L3_9ROSI|nr:hypothetical protein Dsin_001769 [Dipteronia sinensis]